MCEHRQDLAQNTYLSLICSFNLLPWALTDEHWHCELSRFNPLLPRSKDAFAVGFLLTVLSSRGSVAPGTQPSGLKALIPVKTVAGEGQDSLCKVQGCPHRTRGTSTHTTAPRSVLPPRHPASEPRDLSVNTCSKLRAP